MCGVSEFNVGQIQSQGEKLSAIINVRFIFRICEVRELLAVIDSLVLRQESGRPLQL